MNGLMSVLLPFTTDFKMFYGFVKHRVLAFFRAK